MFSRYTLERPYSFSVAKQKITYVGELTYYSYDVKKYPRIENDGTQVKDEYLRDVEIFRSIFKNLSDEPVQKAIMQPVTQAQVPSLAEDKDDF